MNSAIKWTPKFEIGDNIKYRDMVLSIKGIENKFGTYKIDEHAYISGQRVDEEGEKVVINRIDEEQSGGSKSRRNRKSKKSKGKSRKNNRKSSRRRH